VCRVTRRPAPLSAQVAPEGDEEEKDILDDSLDNLPLPSDVHHSKGSSRRVRTKKPESSRNDVDMFDRVGHIALEHPRAKMLHESGP
jgi:hypothetical protein